MPFGLVYAEGNVTDLPTISPFRFGRSRVRSWGCFRGACAEHSRSVVAAAQQAECLFSRRRPPRRTALDDPRGRRDEAPAAFRTANASGSGRLAIVAALVAGGALSFCLARAGRAVPVPAAPADRQDAPPATRPGPSIKPLTSRRSASGRGRTNSGASAPFRDSAALRRNGEVS